MAVIVRASFNALHLSMTIALMQTKLLEMGFSCGDEEVDDMIFGDATQSALATLQASC